MSQAQSVVTLLSAPFNNNLWADFPFKISIYYWLIDLAILKESQEC